jgi:ribosomal protein S6--L-glutamate ligase
MKIVILSQNSELYSTRRLVEAGEAEGHEMHVIDPMECYMDITSNCPSVHHDGKKLEGVTAVIPRIAPKITPYGTAVLRQFEVSGSFVLNSSLAIVQSRDKLRLHQIMAQKGLGMPNTAYASSTESTKELINLVGGPPLVIKLSESTQGKGVVLTETFKAAESVINAFRGLNANFLIQEFIKESRGEDIRCFVIGDKVVAAILRQAGEGEFRSNLHLGGTAHKIKITPEERVAAVKASKISGLKLSGVDIIRSNYGPLILEVNSSPGLEGIENCTGINIASKIIQFIYKSLNPS